MRKEECLGSSAKALRQENAGDGKAVVSTKEGCSRVEMRDKVTVTV